jgi:hypothetical protein
MSKTSLRAVVAAAVLATGGSALFAPNVFASASHPNPAGQVIEIGPSPVGVGNCSFANNDASFMVVSGHAVSHETSNKNGDWGGLTFTGTAIFQEAPYMDMGGMIMDTGAPVQMYEGHLSYWTGGGNNAGGQTEGGLTLDFHGTAISGSGATGSFDLHVNGHQTTNDAGNITANVTNVNVTCS